MPSQWEIGRNILGTAQRNDPLYPRFSLVGIDFLNEKNATNNDLLQYLSLGIEAYQKMKGDRYASKCIRGNPGTTCRKRAKRGTGGRGEVWKTAAWRGGSTRGAIDLLKKHGNGKIYYIRKIYIWLFSYYEINLYSERRFDSIRRSTLNEMLMWSGMA